MATVIAVTSNSVTPRGVRPPAFVNRNREDWKIGNGLFASLRRYGERFHEERPKNPSRDGL